MTFNMEQESGTWMSRDGGWYTSRLGLFLMVSKLKGCKIWQGLTFVAIVIRR